MKRESSKVLAATISKLLRREADPQIRNIVQQTHSADLAYTLFLLPLEQRGPFFEYIEDVDRAKAGEALAELEDSLAVKLIRDLDNSRLVKVLEAAASDDTADLLELVRDEDRRDKLVAMMRKEEQAETESLLAFDPESAGGLMSTDFFALEQETTAKEALDQLQEEAGEAEVVFYLYVVNEHGGLVGVASLRELVRAKKDMPLKEFMISDVVRARVDTDQEEVAGLIARYNFVALPVVDANNRLVGIVTVDDIIDVIRSEATEDMLLMAGAGDEDVSRYSSPFFSFRTRLPWLLPSFLGGILAMFVLWSYGAALAAMVPLAALIPVIIGMSGNIGTQSSAIVTRGISLGRSGFVALGRVVLKETLVGIFLGVAYGIFVAGIAGLVFRNSPSVSDAGLALFVGAVAAATLASMTLATALGAVVPILFKRLGLDPATATGPFVITTIDVLGVWTYMLIASTLLPV
jgi:magnesium transporter